MRERERERERERGRGRSTALIDTHCIKAFVFIVGSSGL